MRRFKEGFFLLPSVVLAIAAVVGFSFNTPVFPIITYPEKVVNEEVTKSVDEIKEKKDTVYDNTNVKVMKVSEYNANSEWKDGVYTGTGMGYGGNIEVKVTVKDGKIVNIQVTDHSKETPSYYDKAAVMIDRIITAQSPNVDTVSGATYSSNGIREAVIQALNKASGNNVQNINSKKNTDNNKKDSNKKVPDIPKGKPANGTYKGSAVCEQFMYTVNLKVKFKNGKAVAISGLNITNNDDKANEAYWKKAWKPMVKRILKKQSTEVDVVSGATLSSNAILAAYQNAYAKAVEANGGDTKQNSNKNKSEETPEMEDVTQPVITGTVKDGIYAVSAICEPDENKGFKAYTMMADITFLNGKLSSIANLKSTDESNRNYYLKAANGNAKYPGVISQLIEKQSVSGINAVSGATCSSKTIRLLYIRALTLATGVNQEELVENETETEAGNENATEENTLWNDDSQILAAMDGTFNVSVTVIPDEWEEFMDYTMTADVIFVDKKLTAIENIVLSDTVNLGYCNLAAYGTQTKIGIINQLISKQNKNVDIISGATCSSWALIELYEKALEMSRQQREEIGKEKVEENEVIYNQDN